MNHRITPPQPIIDWRPAAHDAGKRMFGWTCPICGYFTGIRYGVPDDARHYGRMHIRKDH